MFEVVRYYVKYFILFFLCVALGTLFLPIFIIFPFNVWNFNFPIFGFKMLARAYGIDVQIKNKQRIDMAASSSNDGPFVMVCNHQSAVDMMVLSHFWPRKCTVMAKREIFYMATFGIALWLCGAIFVDRGNSKKARKTLDDALEKIVTERLRLFMFPEGTRNKKNEILPFKKGAFHMAVQAQIPIVPAVISSLGGIVSHAPQKYFRRGTVYVSVLEPISTKGCTPEDVERLTLQCHEQMSREFSALNALVTPPISATNTSPCRPTNSDPAKK